nr:zinc finger, CCHC-type [Tanacetum cinerariifolium]
MGEADVILGIKIKHESNGLAISRSHYIEKVMKKLNYSDCTPVSTPLDTYEKLMPNKGPSVSQHSRVIGCLMYAMTCIKPDIAFDVGKLSSYPSVLEGYTDASLISNSEDNSSTSGWVFLLGGGVISWASKKQTCIAGSTMEYKFMALAAAGKEARWLKNLLLEIPLWVKPITHISIHCDSAATLDKTNSQMYNGNSRHLGVRHIMICELITNVVVSIEFVRSQQNLADHLTKGLARDLVIKSAEGMGLKMCLEPADKEDEVANFSMVNFFEKVLSRRINKKEPPMDLVIPVNGSGAGSESRPHMLNKENYVPWSSRLLRYAKSRPNGKLIHNYILNGPYVRKMILEPGDANRNITVTETFHLQTDDELSDKELKKIEADDQQMMKGSDIRIQEKKAKFFNEWERFTSNKGESIESYYYRFLKLMNDLKRNKHFPEKIGSNLKFLNNLQPEWSRHVTIVHQTKDLHTADYTQLYDFLKYNQNEVDELKAERIAKTQDPLALMENSNNPYVIQNAVQNPRVQNVRNQNGLIGVQGNGNQNRIGNGNLVTARDEGNAKEKGCCLSSDTVIDCSEERGRNPTPSRRTDSTPVYDTDGSAEVHENCDDNEILNMFTQEEQYTELLEPIPESHQVLQNDNDVISEDTSVEQGGETVEQHPANFEETRALYESLYQNLAIEVEKVNSVNRKLKETNADLIKKDVLKLVKKNTTNLK